MQLHSSGDRQPMKVEQIKPRWRCRNSRAKYVHRSRDLEVDITNSHISRTYTAKNSKANMLFLLIAHKLLETYNGRTMSNAPLCREYAATDLRRKGETYRLSHH